MIAKATVLLGGLATGSGGTFWRRGRRHDDAPLLRRMAAALTKTGEELLPAVVAEIASLLGASLSFVGELTDDGHVRTAAAFRDGEPAGGFSFPIEGTACTQLLSSAESLCLDDAATLFPDDPTLAGGRGWAGVALVDARQSPIGVLVAVMPGPIGDTSLAASVLELFSARVAAEMQRERTEQELRRREEHLLQVQRVEAIGRLAGGVAHDFNNLLMIMIGYAEILRDRDGASTEVTELLTAAHRATTLTRQLLAYGRRQVLQAQRVDLNSVVEGVCSMLGPLIGSRVELTTALDRSLPAVEADPGQFEQVLVNLALNARDAMPEGGALKLETRVETLATSQRQMPAGTYVCLAVSDTGTGMPPEVQAHIFEPFYTTKGTGGTGLGLSSVYGIVKQSGGFIWCSSEVGRGTTFTIYLLPSSGGRAAVSPAAIPDAAHSGRERILVVDDEPGVRRLIARLLRSKGYEVQEAEDAHRALEFLEEASVAVDLIVSDVVMPGISGIDFSAMVEARWPDVKLLFVTGFAQGDRSAHGITSRPMLSKPFTVGKLATTVRNTLEGRSPGPAANGSGTPPPARH